MINHQITKGNQLSRYFSTCQRMVVFTIIVSFTLLLNHIDAANNEQPLRPWIRPRPSRAQPAIAVASATNPQSASQAGSATPISTAAALPLVPATGSASEILHLAPLNAPLSTNRSTRTADVFQNGDGYNLFVTNTCERESMRVNIRTSRPFFGVIHTRNQRQKPNCVVEGNGETEYNLEISHVLNSQDPAYCGVIRARRDSPEDKDMLSVVIAVRLHRNIELSDDKFFLLNCTNRCRKPDCSSPSAKLFDSDDSLSRNNGRLSENEGINGGERETTNGNVGDPNECTIWKFPWAITLLWCLGILLLAMIISHCIMCSSMRCRCIRTEVEEKEPSIYEGATDDEDLYNKRHPYRIDYDNRDIYKTSNNYAPYNLEEAQTKSREKRRKGSR